MTSDECINLIDQMEQMAADFEMNIGNVQNMLKGIKIDNNDLGFVSTERRYEAPMCCTPGASK